MLSSLVHQLEVVHFSILLGTVSWENLSDKDKSLKCTFKVLIVDSVLTHLCQMYFPILINWLSPFPILELFGGIFLFYSNVKANRGEPDQMPHIAASDMALHCLPMSHKRTLGLYGIQASNC